jgi:ATP/ADP translocase/CRP-like cAMP-binding protein/HEAT repeat protein
MIARLLKPFVQTHSGEVATVLLMFAYSFLAMAGYNMIKPVTRGLFIEKLGAENLPWIQFGAGVVIGFIMQGYTRVITAVPRRWMIPITLSAITVLMAAFYVLLGVWPTNRSIAVGFYLFGLIVGILLISQFWTLANDVYDPRQAKRIFGFIGAGASLGGFAGATVTATIVERIGTNGVLLVSAATLSICTFTVAGIIRREPTAGQSDASKTGEERGVSGSEAIRLLQSSRHLQTIAMVIGFAAIGAAIIEQQLNMAAAQEKGAANVGAVTAFLSQVVAYTSIIGFVVQILLTSRIHRYLGIGFALLIIPVVDASTGLLMLLSGALWTSGLARVMDTSLRYTVDKTTREILFLPLPVGIKYQAKPFIDVTVDRLAKGVGALILLVLVQPWGLGLGWRQLSYASVTMMAIWATFALTARREYLLAFRRSIEQQAVKPQEIRLESGDLSSIETLVTELAHPEPRRVLYAIDMLDALDKRQFVTPLLLFHGSAEVRARALGVARASAAEGSERWLPAVERALSDEDGEVRLAAARALAAIRGKSAAEVMRPFLDSPDPNLAVTAAAALASSDNEADVATAEDTFKRFVSDTRASSAGLRQQVARALGLVRNPRFRPLLVGLMYDADFVVASAAIKSAGTIAGDDFLFVPTLVTVMRNRRLKPLARTVLIEYGEAVVAPLAYFMTDREEDIWVRRHVPGTLAHIPTAASVATLISALDDPDGFLRFKAVMALQRLRRDHSELAVDREVIERHVIREAGRAFEALTLFTNLFVTGALNANSLLARALEDKRSRALNRVFQLLSLVYPAGDIAAVQASLGVADARMRSGAIELLDNLLPRDMRKHVMLLVDEMPADERVRKGNALYKTRPRDIEDTLAQLIHDDNQVISAAAIHMVEERRLWSLSDDLEYVLAHRDPRDWYCFEAASWALAASRMPVDRRKQLWQEPLPAVELANRLRTLPIFAFTSVDELFRIASVGRQVRYEAGRVLYHRGVAPESLQLLLDGRAATEATEELVPPAPLAFEAVLEGRPVASDIRTMEPSICLSLTTDEFLSVLAENVELTEGIFRWIIESRQLQSRGPVSHGELMPDVKRKVERGLQPVDRVLLLQASPLLSRATGAQLLRLAGVARPVTFTAGANPLAGSAEQAILAILTGALDVTAADGRTERAEPGDVIGVIETLGGLPFAAAIVAASDGTALRFNRSDLFELLADDTALVQGIVSGLLAASEHRAAEAAVAVGAAQ